MLVSVRALGLLVIAGYVLGCDHGGSGSGRSRGIADAERDLARGEAAIMTASGIAHYPLTPDVDPETGLRFHDTGCVVDQPYQDAYNATVRSSVAAHGLPASSLKGLILDARAVDDALGKGSDLAPGATVAAPDGRRAELRGEALHVEGRPFARPYELPVGGASIRVRLAWAPAGQVLIRVTGPRSEGFSGDVRAQIDPGCACLIQVLR